jgi:amidophosphoribosyltransferase
MAELHHECGIVAVYHFRSGPVSPLVPAIKGPNGELIHSRENTARLVPRLLLDIQNRGQLAAGMTSFKHDRTQLLNTFKDVGTVTEVFELNQADRYDAIMKDLTGPAAIGHVRYATCGKDDRNHAQPFERPHVQMGKWFSFAFNGQLANYAELKDEIVSRSDFHLARETDTEVIMHALAHEISGDRRPTFTATLGELAKKFDGAYNIAYINAFGSLFVSRDSLGIRPLCYAREGSLFAAASESVALANVGFRPENIHSLEPGSVIVIENDEMRIEKYDSSPRQAHCFFEWIYFANVASTLDGRSVYLSRKSLGEELAASETLQIDRSLGDTIVVPVPDTAKAAADAMAYKLGIPCLEGLIRNRYIGRTFIEGNKSRGDKVRMKYTPLAEVLKDKRVILVEDTIVRSTTMKALIHQIRDRGHAREVHVRVACPPILSPCFYGIDMSTVKELFAPKFLKGQPINPEVEAEMARTLGADSLRYLPLESIAKSVDKPRDSICQACLDGRYPTPAGRRLYQIALDDSRAGTISTCESAAEGSRTYEVARAAHGTTDPEALALAATRG